MGKTSPGNVLRFSGLLDVRRAAETREALHECIEDGNGDVVVDLSEVDGIDATVMAVLAAAALRLQRAGRSVVLQGCAPQVRRLFACRGWRRFFVWDREVLNR